MTIGKKISAGYWLALAILITIGLLAYLSTMRLIENNRAVSRTNLALAELDNLLSLLKDAETGQRGYVITGKESYKAPYEAALEKLEPAVTNLRGLTDDARQQRRIDTLQPLIRDKLAELAETIKARAKDGFEAAAEIVSDDRGKSIMDKIRTLVDEMRSQETGQLKVRTDDAESSARVTLYVIGIGAALAAVCVQGIGSVITRSITKPLQLVVEQARRIAQGDLTGQKLVNHSDDEVGQLALAFNDMTENLKNLAGQTLGVSENLNASSAEILASTQQQAAGTKEQAATIQQITTTMEEVRQSGSQISEKAKQVATSAEATSSSGAAGLGAVQTTSRTMEAIRAQVEEVAENIVDLSEKTQAVGEIIATVNDIAERSNLLALNAAIEAAGAGEQGSRFSVVAAEIKNLADQAKESTVQVRTILQDIQKRINSSVMLTEEAVKRVESGKRQADVTEQTIHQMAETTQESVQAFQQIIGATGQQQIAFEQVTQGMHDIRQAASQTAAGTLQLERAVSDLNSQSLQLRAAVSRYRVH